MHKKAVSPLIATVLLISFAVALATVIVQLDFFGVCSNLVLDVSNKNNVCYSVQEDSIKLTIENNARNVDIGGFEVRIIGSKDASNKYNFPVSIERRSSDNIFIPYDSEQSGAPTKITLWPIVNDSGSEELCDQNVITISNIVECETE